MARVGTTAKKSPRRLTFAQERAQLKLPYTSVHRSEEEICRAVACVNKQNQERSLRMFAFKATV